MRFSIRHKILSVLGILLLAAIGFYTLLASQIFTEQKTALLYDLNHSIAVNMAAQLRSSIQQVSSQLRLYSLSQILSETSEFRLAKDFLSKNKIEKALIFEKTSQGYRPFRTQEGASSREIASLLPESEDQISLTASDARGTRYWVGTPMPVTVGKTQRQFITLGEVDGSIIHRNLQNSSLFQSYLMTAKGKVLVHVDRDTLVPPKPIANYPLLATALAQPGKSGVSSFDFDNDKWYGAYTPVGVGDLYLFSQANRKEVTGAISTLVKRSLLFGIIVVTLTFIASILFSKRLTKNLQTLTFGAQRIEKGDLQSKIDIQSRDEVSELAQSFNAMMDSLRISREKIEQYNRELEDKVSLRTKQLQESNAAIKEVQEKLLKTTQLAAVGEVAGRTAHELLNPLTAIASRLERSQQVVGQTGGQGLPIQFNEILSAWEDDYRKGGMDTLSQSLKVPSSVKPEITLFEEDLENLKKLADFWKRQTETIGGDIAFVREQAERIHRIVDGMREMSRSSVKDDVDCIGALKEAVLTMSDFLSKHHVKLESQLSVRHATAHLNRDELIQVVTNLIRNAYQAIASHSKEDSDTKGIIRISAQVHESSLLVDILDNGIGIAPENQGKIFDQGFTTKPPEEGTGIGLAICRRYAREFGGEVDLQFSSPEKGTCFRIRIPIQSAEAVPAVAS